MGLDDEDSTQPRYASGFVIMLNLATIGVEAELSLERGAGRAWTMGFRNLQPAKENIGSTRPKRSGQIGRSFAWKFFGRAGRRLPIAFDRDPGVHESDRERGSFQMYGLDPGEEFGAESWPYLVERLFLAVYFVEAVARALASGS